MSASSLTCFERLEAKGDCHRCKSRRLVPTGPAATVPRNRPEPPSPLAAARRQPPLGQIGGVGIALQFTDPLRAGRNPGWCRMLALLSPPIVQARASDWLYSRNNLAVVRRGTSASAAIPSISRQVQSGFFEEDFIGAGKCGSYKSFLV